MNNEPKKISITSADTIVVTPPTGEKYSYGRMCVAHRLGRAGADVGLTVEIEVTPRVADDLIAALEPCGSYRQGPDEERVEIRRIVTAVLGGYDDGKTNVERVRQLAECHRNVVSREKRLDAVHREDVQKRGEMDAKYAELERLLRGTDLDGLSPKDALVRLLAARRKAAEELAR